MDGFNKLTRQYILRDSHGRSLGVTAHVELDIGQEVTVARLSRNLDRIVAVQGELVDCRDTTSCRTTLSIRVPDVRMFIRQAFGNHHALVYGNHIEPIRKLGQKLGISLIDI